MGSNYKKLGGYIRQIDLRNSDASLGEDNLYGISVTKEFIISHANLVGVIFDSYKVVAPRQFAYIPDTSRRGDKIAISLNTFGEDIIVSSICSVFEIIDENQLLPEYLMLWFMRPEFDRYARFMSNGSAREVFDWDCMCGVELPVPPISEQRKIVHDYQVITDRIELLGKMNENLEETMETVFKSFVSEKGQDDCETVYKALKVINGTAFSSDYFNTDMNGYPLVRIRDLSACNPDVYTSEVLPGIEYVNAGDILVGMDGEFIPHVWYGSTGVLNQRVCKIVPVKQAIHPMFLFWTLKPILAEIQRTQGGTTVIHIGKKDFDKMVCTHMTEDEHKNFYEKVDPMFKLLVLNNKEILKLSSMVTMIQSSMSNIS